MNSLPSEILELKHLTREFAEREVAPIAQWLDQTEGEIPQELVAKMGEMGFFGVLAKPEYGGFGYGALGVAVVSEELCRISLSVGSLPARNWMNGLILAEAGTPAQKDQILPFLISGQKQTASAGTEPEAGSDGSNIKVRAERRGDSYVINGTKMWCTNANRAEILFTYCRTSDAPKHKGVSLIMVQKKPGDNFVPPRLTGQRVNTVGYHGMNTYQLFFDDLEVPVADRIGNENEGFKYLMK